MLAPAGAAGRTAAGPGLEVPRAPDRAGQVGGIPARLAPLTITPDPSKVGEVVSGFVYIDTFNATVYSGDEVVRLPYRYTVAP